MTDQIESDLEKIRSDLARAFRGVLLCKWDQRFETVLAEFRVDKKDNIRAILERHLSATWDSSNAGNAPDLVRAIVDSFGGLRRGQFLFTSDPNRDALIFCTWWPWVDGKEISIRIGLAYKNLSDLERAEKMQLFKSWFGV